MSKTYLFFSLDHCKCLWYATLQMENQPCYISILFPHQQAPYQEHWSFADLILLIMWAGVQPVLSWRCEG